jgi:hypothetical protein
LLELDGEMPRPEKVKAAAASEPPSDGPDVQVPEPQRAKRPPPLRCAGRARPSSEVQEQARTAEPEATSRVPSSAKAVVFMNVSLKNRQRCWTNVLRTKGEGKLCGRAECCLFGRWCGPPARGAPGRPEIQSFFGALAGQKAKKRVFITTSTFTKEAREYGAHVSENVVLLDGARPTALMIEAGVAVTHHRTIRLPRVDGDYFEAE